MLHTLLNSWLLRATYLYYDVALRINRVCHTSSFSMLEVSTVALAADTIPSMVVEDLCAQFETSIARSDSWQRESHE